MRSGLKVMMHLEKRTKVPNELLSQRKREMFTCCYCKLCKKLFYLLFFLLRPSERGRKNKKLKVP